MKSFFDPYSLKARVFPAFLVLLPAFLAISAWLPQDNIPKLAFLGLSGNVVLGFFAAERVRDVGKSKEPSLWKAWGGAPTTLLLRWSNTDITPATRNLWRASIEKITGALLPNASSESRAPDKADKAYDAAILQLRERTRDAEKFPLVLKENIGYGFRRNLWAMKPVGITLSAAGTLAALFRFTAIKLNDEITDINSFTVFAICVIFFTSWTLVITKSWVRAAAFEYAKRLLGSSIHLAGNP